MDFLGVLKSGRIEKRLEMFLRELLDGFLTSGIRDLVDDVSFRSETAFHLGHAAGGAAKPVEKDDVFGCWSHDGESEKSSQKTGEKGWREALHDEVVISS